MTLLVVGILGGPKVVVWTCIVLVQQCKF